MQKFHSQSHASLKNAFALELPIVLSFKTANFVIRSNEVKLVTASLGEPQESLLAGYSPIV